MTKRTTTVEQLRKDGGYAPYVTICRHAEKDGYPIGPVKETMTTITLTIGGEEFKFFKEDNISPKAFYEHCVKKNLELSARLAGLGE